MSNKYMHTNLEDYTSQKIYFSDPRAYENNMKILKIVALNGPLLKYGIHKIFGGRYSTVSRRVDDLYENEYLGHAGERLTERGRQTEENLYGLSWKGFIASLTHDEIRKCGVQVIRINSLLVIPEKDVVLEVIQELYSPDKIELYFTAFLIGYIHSNAPPLERIKNEDLMAWLIPILRESVQLDFIHDLEASPETVNLFTLLDKPAVLHYVKNRLIPQITDYEKRLRESFIFYLILNELGQYLNLLSVEDRPSQKLMDYLESEEFSVYVKKLEKLENFLEDSK